MWKENIGNDRLIYVDLGLQLGMTPVINPFEISGIEASDTSLEALKVKKVVAQELLSAFQQVLAQGHGSELSANMETVLKQCIPVLLDTEGATIRDLMRSVN